MTEHYSCSYSSVRYVDVASAFAFVTAEAFAWALTSACYVHVDADEHEDEDEGEDDVVDEMGVNVHEVVVAYFH